MPIAKTSTRRKPGPKPKTGRKKPGPKPKMARRKPGPKPKSARKKPGPKPGSRRPGRKPSGRVKKPFSIVLDAVELKALKDIAKKKNSSVAGLIRGAMNAVIFQANPQMARVTLEKDVDAFFDGIKGKLPMKTRFEDRKKGLKKTLVRGIISEMETL